MKLQADPPTVFTQGVLRLNVDLDNQNSRSIKNVLIDVFDTGVLEGETCRRVFSEMTANQFITFFCVFAAPDVTIDMTEEIHAKATYTTDFSSVQVIEMMTESEYQRRLSTNQLDTKPARYLYRDKNIELEVEFSEQIPIIVRPGKEYFVHFTVRNIGNGFVREIMPGDFSLSTLRQGSPDIIECQDFKKEPAPSGVKASITRSMSPVGREFPRITCRLLLPQGVTVVENYGLLIVTSYDYEVRETVKVGIVK